MEFRKPKSAEIASGVAQVAGATLGFMAPNGIANAVAKVDNEAVISEKQKTTKMYVNAGLLVSGIALALMVKGADTGANALRGAGYGLAGGSIKGLVSHFAKEKVDAIPNTTTKRLVAGALGCPCTAEKKSFDWKNQEYYGGFVPSKEDLRTFQAVQSLGNPYPQYINPAHFDIISTGNVSGDIVG